MKENPLLLKESNLLLVLHLFLEYKKSFHLIFKIYERGYLQKSKDKNSCITKNPKNKEKNKKQKSFSHLKSTRLSFTIDRIIRFALYILSPK